MNCVLVSKRKCWKNLSPSTSEGNPSCTIHNCYASLRMCPKDWLTFFRSICFHIQIWKERGRYLEMKECRLAWDLFAYLTWRMKFTKNKTLSENGNDNSLVPSSSVIQVNKCHWISFRSTDLLYTKLFWFTTSLQVLK